jgi:drug/metabolite transporter (DMT)-like permease
VLTVAATNAYSITLLRAIVASLACLGICAVVLGKRMFRIARGDVRTMVVAGLLMAMYQVTFVISISLANVSIAALVALCTVPVLAAVLSRVLLGEALRPTTLLALVFAIVGVALLVGFDNPARSVSPRMGVGFALVAALSFTLFQICGRVLASRYRNADALGVLPGGRPRAATDHAASGFVTHIRRWAGFCSHTSAGDLGRDMPAGARTAHDHGHDVHDHLAARAADEHAAGVAPAG